MVARLPESETIEAMSLNLSQEMNSVWQTNVKGETYFDGRHIKIWLTPLKAVLLGSSRSLVLGVLVGLIGALVLIIAGATFNESQNYWYSAFVLMATIGYGLSVNMIKKYLNDVNALAIVTGNFVIIVIPAVLILIFTGFFNEILDNEAMQVALGYVVILSLFGTAIAKVIYSRLVQISSPVFVS